jgi:hypothetical protein
MAFIDAAIVTCCEGDIGFNNCHPSVNQIPDLRNNMSTVTS